MIGLVLACVAGPAADSAAAPADPAAPFTITPPPPSWTAAEVAERVNAALAYGLPDPVEIDAAYRDAFRQGDGRCPPSPGPEAGFQLDQSSCVSEGGTIFSGVANYAVDVDRDPATDDWQMGICSFVITSPSGDVFTCGGTYGYAKEATEAGWAVSAFVKAVVAWPGGPAWAALGAGAAFEVSGTVGEGGMAYTLAGALAYGDTDLYFDGLDYDPARCDGLPSYTGRLRDPSGYWYRFTGGETCDPCGAVTYEGQALGVGCVDATSAASTLAASLVPS